MKLEVGMYVRLKNGIYKINYFINNSYTQKFTYIDNMGVSNILEEKEVVKASHNIIDLIEVGDYVNGSLVIEIRDYTDDNIRRIVTERSAMYSVAIREDELLDNLESIATKEQFESMSYKVKE
jgi:DNA helicase TIP49 (TBP-interacting protein)